MAHRPEAEDAQLLVIGRRRRHQPLSYHGVSVWRWMRSRPVRAVCDAIRFPVASARTARMAVANLHGPGTSLHPSMRQAAVPQGRNFTP